ncbi:MAG: hypothetical protein QM786_15185 [Breznakibacter sp.]
MPQLKTFMLSLFCLAVFTGHAQTNVFPASGNVGIGTTSPGGRLHVRGGIAIQNPQYGFDDRGTVNERAGIIFGCNHPTNNSMFWISPDATSGNRLNIGCGLRYLDESSALTLLWNGNLGVGVVTPGAKLDVAGTIRATEIKVEAQTADFVFDENYALRDLKDVESFIRTHKHLPDIPSAARMEADGVNLAEMNKLLLQKIEELTLYLLAQQKTIEKQDEALILKNASINKLHKEIESLGGRFEELEMAVKQITENNQ